MACCKYQKRFTPKVTRSVLSDLNIPNVVSKTLTKPATSTSPPTNGWNDMMRKTQTKRKHGKDRVLIQVIRDDFVVDTHILVLKGARTTTKRSVEQKKSRFEIASPKHRAINFRWGSSVKWGRIANETQSTSFRSRHSHDWKKIDRCITRYISGIPQYVYTLNFPHFHLSF